MGSFNIRGNPSHLWPQVEATYRTRQAAIRRNFILNCFLSEDRFELIDQLINKAYIGDNWQHQEA